ncbi:MAG: hypothetical protein Q8Q59_00265 [Luteolibacter sp.]|jgi:hypothetical protein|nr:hypothetical protein [Luteolibacter sp.]
MSKTYKCNIRRTIYKLALALKDISSAELTCKGFKIAILASDEKISHEVNYAFMTAITTCYARPFVDNKSTGVLQKHWRKFTDRRLQETHDLIMKARHEVYAHSDSKIARLFIVPAGAMMRGAGRTAPRSSWFFETYEFPPDAIMNIHDCCIDLKQRLETEVSRLVDELCASGGTPETEFELKGGIEGETVRTSDDDITLH